MEPMDRANRLNRSASHPAPIRPMLHAPQRIQPIELPIDPRKCAPEEAGAMLVDHDQAIRWTQWK